DGLWLPIGQVPPFSEQPVGSLPSSSAGRSPPTRVSIPLSLGARRAAVATASGEIGSASGGRRRPPLQGVLRIHPQAGLEIDRTGHPRRRSGAVWRSTLVRYPFDALAPCPTHPCRPGRPPLHRRAFSDQAAEGADSEGGHGGADAFFGG